MRYLCCGVWFRLLAGVPWLGFKRKDQADIVTFAVRPFEARAAAQHPEALAGTARQELQLEKPRHRRPEARTLLVLLNTFISVLLTARKLAATGQPEDLLGAWQSWLSPVINMSQRSQTRSPLTIVTVGKTPNWALIQDLDLPQFVLTVPELQLPGQKNMFSTAGSTLARSAELSREASLADAAPALRCLVVRQGSSEVPTRIST